jgi:diguanylate cyclase (GGDEF)-like protein
MISIKSYLIRSFGFEEASRRAIGVLLQALEAHAVQGDDIDYEQFRSHIRELSRRFTEQTTADELLVVAGAVAASLREYGERTTRYVRAQSAEYQQMLSMLTETIATMTQGSERSITRLRDIEKQLESASIIEDVRTIRLKLGQCLESLREEVEAQENTAAVTATELRESIARSHAYLESVVGEVQRDPVTGLPGRQAAEAAFAEAAASTRSYYVIAFIADRIQAINSRFGYAVGDRVLRKICSHFRGALSADDHIFRWRGPSFVALVESGPAISDVRREVAQIWGTKMDELTQVGSRSVLLPISATCAVFPMTRTVGMLTEKIDQFVTSQGFVDS